MTDTATPLLAPTPADILVDQGGLPFLYRVQLYSVTPVPDEEEPE